MSIRIRLGFLVLPLDLDAALEHGTKRSHLGSLPDVFPLEMIWLAPITLIIGGGGLVFNSVLYIIVADISTDTQRFV